MSGFYLNNTLFLYVFDQIKKKKLNVVKNFIIVFSAKCY